MDRKSTFLWICLLTHVLSADFDSDTGDFSGIRLGTQIGLSLHYMEPQRPNSASSGISFFSPAIKGNILAGNVTSEVVYWGLAAFGSYLYGKERSNHWTVVPRHDMGMGVVLGSVVENTFLTSISFGVKKTRYDIADGNGPSAAESMNMVFFGVRTEGALTDKLSSEVSYDYSLALSREGGESHYRYAKRTTAHMFGIGLVLRL